MNTACHPPPPLSSFGAVFQGGRSDDRDLVFTFKMLWPSIPQQDLINTQKWAITVGLDALKDDREAIQVLAKNMRDTRELGRVLLELEKSLTRSEYSCSLRE